MIEIGAGGGSIANVDSLGLLKVGPRSAGSAPGPACYGQGGKEPTVTDADLALGLLDGDNFLGGDMRLDKQASEDALWRLGEKLGTDMAQTAAGIYRVVAETMAAAARTHATDRGVDHRGLPLLAFGGAGPVHACAVGALLESTSVIFPPNASVLSAFGTLVTSVRFDLVRSAPGRLGALDWDDVGRLLGEMTGEGLAALAEAGCPEDTVTLIFGADLRYFGQQNEVTITFDHDPLAGRDAEMIRRIFEGAYLAQYGVNPSHVPIEIVSWRLTVHGPDIAVNSPNAMPGDWGRPKAQRTILLWPDLGPTPIYDRSSLAADQAISGPAVIEERETTIVLPPEWDATVDAIGCVIAKRRI
jgi:N-methylhydantoinase A